MDMLASPNGIILITGATGSGKSTTVYSMLQKLNKEETNIITVEDPVEMSIEGLNQVQVNSEIGLDFATVLRSILRQDPNVVVIGEIRDSETARIAIRASITGHLVLSTLHTNNSLTTIERLIDMDVERYLLSSSLKGIISQTLAKKLCPNCRVQRPATDMEKTLFKKVLGVDIEYTYDTGRCDHCHNGYTGRIALQEVLMINDEIREAINQNIDRVELRHLIYKKNVKTLLQDGLIKVLEGITDLKEVLRLVDYDESDDIFSASNNLEYNKINNNTSVMNSNVIANDVTNQVNNENNNMVNTILEPAPNNINENLVSDNNNVSNNVVAVPNYNTNQEAPLNNEIIEPSDSNNIFNNTNEGNLFEDNVFNSLRINNNTSANTDTDNTSQNTSGGTNYTNNLINLIDNELKG